MGFGLDFVGLIDRFFCFLDIVPLSMFVIFLSPGRDVAVVSAHDGTLWSLCR